MSISGLAALLRLSADELRELFRWDWTLPSRPLDERHHVPTTKRASVDTVTNRTATTTEAARFENRQALDSLKFCLFFGERR